MQWPNIAVVISTSSRDLPVTRLAPDLHPVSNRIFDDIGHANIYACDHWTLPNFAGVRVCILGLMGFYLTLPPHDYFMLKRHVIISLAVLKCVTFLSISRTKLKAVTQIDPIPRVVS